MCQYCVVQNVWGLTVVFVFVNGFASGSVDIPTIGYCGSVDVTVLVSLVMLFIIMVVMIVLGLV